MVMKNLNGEDGGDGIRPVLRTFGETTSVKGVGRALKSSKPLMRLVWMTAVLFGLTFALYNIIHLLVRYFEYRTVSITDKDYTLWIGHCLDSVSTFHMVSTSSTYIFHLSCHNYATVFTVITFLTLFAWLPASCGYMKLPMKCVHSRFWYSA